MNRRQAKPYVHPIPQEWQEAAKHARARACRLWACLVASGVVVAVLYALGFRALPNFILVCWGTILAYILTFTADDWLSGKKE